MTGPFNAIEVKAAAGGSFVFSGRGAGGDPTAMAVLADVVELARSAREPRVPPLGFTDLLPCEAASPSEFVSPWSLRFVVHDRPGIIADLARILADHGANIEAVFQEPWDDKRALPFVITLEPVAAGRARRRARADRPARLPRRAAARAAADGLERDRIVVPCLRGRGPRAASRRAAASKRRLGSRLVRVSLAHALPDRRRHSGRSRSHSGSALDADLLSEVPPDAAFYDFVTPPELILAGRVVVLMAAVGIVASGNGACAATRGGGGRSLRRCAPRALSGARPAFPDRHRGHGRHVLRARRAPRGPSDRIAAGFGKCSLPRAQMDSHRGCPLGPRRGGEVPGRRGDSRRACDDRPSRGRPYGSRLKLGLAAVAAACVGAAVGMPALVLKPAAVLEALREQARLYADPALMSWGAPHRRRSPPFGSPSGVYEMGALLPLPRYRGPLLVILRVRRDLRRHLAPWIAFAAALFVSVLGFRFQPFRNLLALVPLFVVAVPVAIASAIPPGRARNLASAVTCVALVASFIPGLLLVRRVYGRRDSRVTLVRRLAGDHGAPRPSPRPPRARRPAGRAFAARRPGHGRPLEPRESQRCIRAVRLRRVRSTRPDRGAYQRPGRISRTCQGFRAGWTACPKFSGSVRLARRYLRPSGDRRTSS